MKIHKNLVAGLGLIALVAVLTTASAKASNTDIKILKKLRTTIEQCANDKSMPQQEAATCLEKKGKMALIACKNAKKNCKNLETALKGVYLLGQDPEITIQIAGQKLVVQIDELLKKPAAKKAKKKTKKAK